MWLSGSSEFYISLEKNHCSREKSRYFRFCIATNLHVIWHNDAEYVSRVHRILKKFNCEKIKIKILDSHRRANFKSSQPLEKNVQKNLGVKFFGLTLYMLICSFKQRRAIDTSYIISVNVIDQNLYPPPKKVKSWYANCNRGCLWGNPSVLLLFNQDTHDLRFLDLIVAYMHIKFFMAWLPLTVRYSHYAILLMTWRHCDDRLGHRRQWACVRATWKVSAR